MENGGDVSNVGKRWELMAGGSDGWPRTNPMEDNRCGCGRQRTAAAGRKSGQQPAVMGDNSEWWRATEGDVTQQRTAMSNNDQTVVRTAR